MTLRPLVVAATATFLLAGCGFKQDLPYKVKFVFESETETCKTEARTVDLAAEEEFQANRDLIKKVTVNDVTLTVTNANYNGRNEATKADGAVGGAPVGTSQQFAIGAAPLTLEVGNSQTIVPDPTSQKRLADLILSKESKFDVIGTACADKVPFSFEAELVVNMTVEAGVF